MGARPGEGLSGRGAASREAQAPPLSAGFFGTPPSGGAGLPSDRLASPGQALRLRTQRQASKTTLHPECPRPECPRPCPTQRSLCGAVDRRGPALLTLGDSRRQSPDGGGGGPGEALQGPGRGRDSRTCEVGREAGGQWDHLLCHVPAVWVASQRRENSGLDPGRARLIQTRIRGAALSCRGAEGPR